MKIGKVTVEHWVYGLALLLAAFLRFNGLGNVPLSDHEATWALQAADLARGGRTLLGGQPGYILLTAAAFFVFGTSEFLARFWPALLGTGLVLAPYLYRERLGRMAALVLALALAIEPVLVAASRQADGRMLAVAGLALAGGFWLKGWLPGIGIGAGVAVLGGASAWNALLAVTLGCGVLRWTAPKPAAEDAPSVEPHWGAVLPWGLGTVVVVGALFGILPGGLSALMNSLVSYIRGWAAVDGAGVGLMLVGWTLLSPLSILFGFSGMIRAWLRQDPVDQALAWVWLFLFVLVLIYPQRQTVDLAYAVVPLLALGARQVMRFVPALRGNGSGLAYTLLVAVLCVSLWMSYSAIVAKPVALDNSDEILRWGGIVATGFLLVASVLLVGWGWNWKVAWVGFSGGVSVVLLAYTLAIGWSGAGLNKRPGLELWVNGAFPSEQNLALKVLGDVSEWKTGHRDGVDLAVSGVDTPSLRWALRNFRNIQFVSALAPDAKTSVILTAEKPDASLGLSLPYTGQGLEWGRTVLWSELLPPDWLGWFFYRELDNRPDIIRQQSLIVWLRSDLFPAADKSVTIH